MECEICGANRPSLKTIMIEGSKINVCDKCAGHGTVLHGVQADPTRIKKRNRYKHEEEFEIVLDYNKLIRDARVKRGWKQEELAKKINEPASLVAHLESGKIIPSKIVAQKLERTLSIKLFDADDELEKHEPQEMRSDPLTLSDVVKIRKR